MAYAKLPFKSVINVSRTQSLISEGDYNTGQAGVAVIFPGHSAHPDYPVRISPTQKRSSVACCEEFEQMVDSERIVDALAWSPDGAKIVSGSWDNTAQFWKLDV